MTRRIILTIISAVAFALLVGLIWFFFFRGGTANPVTNGTFGSGQNKTTTTSTDTGVQGNLPSRVLPAGSQGNAGAGTNTLGGNGGNGSGVIGTVGGSNTGVANVPGVDWLGGNGASGAGGPVSNFVPKTINQLNDGTVSGSPNILPGSNIDSNGNSFLGTALLGAGIGLALCTTGLLGGVAGGTVGAGSTAVGAVRAVPVQDLSLNLQTTFSNTLKSSDTFRDNFLNCIARTIARAAVQQITSSVVNWINSGFNGKPSFVTNFQQFFTNVADQAAGEFIRGTALSFLCTPFKAQIRIALAQSYARRNAQSCTLSGIIKNINSFSNGNFSQGGWGGMLSFVGTPTNNSFGAYNYAQGGLVNAQLQALNQKQQDYTIGKGFLSSEKEVNCRPAPIPPGQSIGTKMICDKEVTTPGSTIADSLSSTLNVSKETLTQAGISGSFDAIISALISQLMVKALQGGVSNLSGTNGYASNFLTPEQQQAQADAQAVLTDMQGRVNLAQQYGSVEQGSISDIQNAQQQLQGVANCWETASSSPSLTTAQQQTAQTNAVNARAALHFYDPQIDAYNNNITHANDGITVLQNLQTRAIGVTSAADVAAVKSAYQQALASGAIITDADVTNAQQDRATLQTALALRNGQSASELQQCYAFK